MTSNKSKKNFKISEIKKNIAKQDIKYTHERKIQFLLDIRGYLLINNIKGNYLEFGSFLSEMQVACFLILKKINLVNNYIGIDIFKKFQGFDSSYKKVKKKIEKISKKLKIINIDLSKKDNLKKINVPINISVIDCNQKISLINSLDHSIKNIVNGGVIYIDDYFLIDGSNLILKSCMEKFLKKHKKKSEFFKTYPPFGTAFIILDNR